MSAPALAKGVRFRRIADGRGIILIPEGMVDLSPSAAAIIELVAAMQGYDCPPEHKKVTAHRLSLSSEDWTTT